MLMLVIHPNHNYHHRTLYLTSLVKIILSIIMVNSMSLVILELYVLQIFCVWCGTVAFPTTNNFQTLAQPKNDASWQRYPEAGSSRNQNLETSVAALPGLPYIPNIPASEFNALHSLYTATNGDRWIWIERPTDGSNVISIPWNFSEPNANPCIQHWQGIVCNSNCTISPKRSPNVFCTVIGLELDSHNLDGTLPGALANLTSLTYLSLADNRIRNPLPDNFLVSMNGLLSLDLSANLLLGGPIPDNFSQLLFLQILDLSRSRFEGSIASSIYQLPSLTYLDIGDNRLEGTISSAICQLPVIEYIFMELNGLTGSIPPCIGSMHSVRTLMLANNSLSQSIPDTLSGLININTFDLSFNHFQHRIPQSLSTLTTIRNFEVQFNLLTGEIPCLLALTELKVLTLYVNELDGPVPNISATTALTLYQINYNQFTGNIVSLNTSNLLAITVQGNYISGSLPPFVNGSRTLVSASLEDDLLQLEPIVDSTEFFKRLASINITTNMLFYVNFSDNVIGGRLPDWIFTSPLLTYVYIFDNIITGPIPDIETNITWIGVLYLDSNYITGTIPKTILQQQYLVNLRLSNNELVGTVSPEIFNSTYLIEVAVENNYFGGLLPRLPPPSFKQYPNLAILSFSNNEFTGQIDTNYFTTLPSLEVFAASSNCLTGVIPTEICESKFLRQLILDGMSSATKCRKFIYPRLRSASKDSSGWFNAFFLEHGIRGKIPSCLFEMPILQSLYLSGNELEGSISSDLNISKSLSNLRLSYNRLEGIIPLVIQERSWTILDLSYNKFTGNLISKFNPTPILSNSTSYSKLTQVSTGSSVLAPYNNLITTNLAIPEPETAREKLINHTSSDSDSSGRSLFLDVNRLSGRLPSSVKDVSDISILNGNIFYCDFSRQALPKNDPKYHSYSCGSNSMNQAMFGWLVAIFVLILFVIGLKYKAGQNKKTLYDEYIMHWLRDIRLYNHAFEMAESKLTLVSPNYSTENISNSADNKDVSVPSAIDSSDVEKIDHVPEVKVLPTVSNVSRMSFVFAWRFFHDLRKYCFIISMILLIVLMPMFRILNIFQSMYENKYAWEFSAIYVSGFASGLILLITFASVIGLVYYWLDMRLHHLMLPPEKASKNRMDNNGNISNQPQQSKKGFKFLRASSFYRDSSYSYSFATAAPNLQTINISNNNDNKVKVEQRVDAEEDVEDRESRATTSTIVLKDHNPSNGSNNHKWFPFFLSFKKRQVLSLLIVGVINIICMTLINISYVIIVVYVTNQYLIIMSQLCLAVTKLWWNDVFLWQLLRGTKRFIHGLWISQELEIAKRNGDTTFASSDGHTNVKERKRLLVEEMVSRMSSEDIFLVVCSLLFNNVVAPCVSIAVVSPSCFYNTLVAAPPLSATYRYCSTYILFARKQGVCLVTIEGKTTFSPPFIYSYNCASLLPVNYTAVYIYMALMSGFVMPAFKLSLKYINENTSIGTNESSILYKLMNRYLSAVLRKLQPHPYLLRKSDLKKYIAAVGIEDPVLIHQELMKDYLPENKEALALKLRAVKPIFDKNRLVVRVIGFLALMASFGVMFPPLALIICLAICSFTYFEQLNIGRVLYQSEQLGYHWYHQKIGYDLEGIVEVFIPAILPMTFVASLLFAFMIFDTFGDQYGTRAAVVPALFMILVPGCIWLTVRVDWVMLRQYLFGKQTASDVRERPHSMAVELKEAGLTTNPLNQGKTENEE